MGGRKIMKPNLLNPGESILEERIRHLEETVTVLLRRQVAITELLKSHGTLFMLLKRFYDQISVEGVPANPDKLHNDIVDVSDGLSKPSDAEGKDVK